MKILHVVYYMGRGGVETWLMNVLRRIDRKEFQMDFLVQTEEKQAYDDEILELGSNILRVRPGSMRLSYLGFLKDFRRVLQDQGPYDVVHAHNTIRYGVLMRESAKAGVPVRIMHSHSYLSQDKRSAILPLTYIGRRLTKKYATLGLGCSKDACTAMFGAGWDLVKNVKPLYYGIDLTPYGVKSSRSEVRAELNLPEDSIVVGHVGRFNWIKNHKFLLQMADYLCKNNQDFRFLFVGDGPGRNDIEEQIKDLNLSEEVILAGLRSDVPRVLSAMDAFVLPSFSEGFGIVLIEAQAMGLPCLFTDSLPDEVVIVDELCKRLKLDLGPIEWSKQVLQSVKQKKITKESSYSNVLKSSFNIETCVKDLCGLYTDSLLEK